jgi:hypothetical protein
MNDHDERHDDWLAARLGGEPIPPEWERVIDECAECRDAVAELGAVQSDLDRAAAHERAVLERVRRPPAESSPTRAEGEVLPLRTALVLRAIAAILVLGTIGLVWHQWSKSNTPTDPGPRLGTSSITELSPAGVVAAITEFHFAAKLPPGGSFRVRVYDPSAGESLVVESPPLSEPRWILDAPTLDRLPRRFHWEVKAYDAAGFDLDSARADVEWPGR